MNNETLYKVIFERKSIRKYDMTPLPASVIENLQEFTGHVKTLDDSIKFECTYLGANDVKNLLPIKAPHYVCLYSEAKPGYLMNAGFVLQQLDLYLSSREIASCWLGMAKPSRQVMEPKGNMEFIIMLAFGNTAEQIHRSDTSVFTRRSISDISEVAGAQELLEARRFGFDGIGSGDEERNVEVPSR